MPLSAAARRGWQPVLDGPLAEAARAAVGEIARAIAPGPWARPEDAVLFLSYAAGALDDAEVTSRCDEAIDRLLARVEATAGGGLGLYGGLAGAGFALAHVSDDDIDDLLVPVDRALLAALSTDTWQEDYDLIGGLTGHGVYFLERLASSPASATARAGLERVVAHLDQLAQRTDGLASWYTPPGLLPDWQRALWPGGYTNCGVAHGVPGVIALLGRIQVELPAVPARAADLCADATSWMRARSQPPDPRGRFPSSVVDGEREAAPARTAWCYGDPGIAAALWAAAARTGAPTGEWRQLAAECARRPAELCGVRDAGLCHGAMGLAHLFNRFYQASGDPLFRAASRDWFERGLAMRRPGEGVAGFLSYWHDPEDGSAAWLPAIGLLDGAAGIGLALLAGLGSEEPGWDRLLLCDLPC